jgi:hypothetical protein
MPNALFMNGVFKETIDDIVETQLAHPERSCYLQPYSSKRVGLLAKQLPTPENPITLYLSLSDSLGSVSWCAKIIGWRNKQELHPAALALNGHIKVFQPNEK